MKKVFYAASDSAPHGTRKLALEVTLQYCTVQKRAYNTSQRPRRDTRLEHRYAATRTQALSVTGYRLANARN